MLLGALLLNQSVRELVVPGVINGSDRSPLPFDDDTMWSVRLDVYFSLYLGLLHLDLLILSALGGHQHSLLTLCLHIDQNLCVLRVSNA